MRPQLRFDRAADCGAGIGRVSKNFLLKRFESVELVEQSPRLLRAAPEYLGEDAARATYLLQGLQVASANQYYLYYYQLNLNSLIVQDFEPAADSYDCIWIQWVIGHRKY